jgi:DNA-binding transcriptional ArsR family regulator
MQESNFVELETLFLALGDKTRLKLLALMADGPVAVGFLADRLDESQPKVSRHLAYLRNAGVVSTRRDGKWIYYGINYLADASQRRILDTVVQSIIVIRIDGEDAFFTEAATFSENARDAGNNTYAEAYGNENADDYTEDDIEEPTQRSDDEEIDIFLL